MQGDPEDADAPGPVLDHGQDIGLGAAGQAGREESRARIASAGERKNCDQAGPVRRRAGPVPLALRISHTVDAAMLTPRPASSPWILRYPPFGVLAGQPADQGLDVPPGRRPASPAAHRPGGPAAADDVTVPAHERVRGSQQPQAAAARLRYHAGQGREQGAVCPVQSRAAWPPPLQDGELVAQDQDLRGLPPCWARIYGRAVSCFFF